jgi:hypothetical protein
MNPLISTECCAVVEDKPSAIPSPIRAYLAAARAGRYLFADVIAEMVKAFNVTAEQAGKWIVRDMEENT